MSIRKHLLTPLETSEGSTFRGLFHLGECWGTSQHSVAVGMSFFAQPLATSLIQNVTDFVRNSDTIYFV